MLNKILSCTILFLSAILLAGRNRQARQPALRSFLPQGNERRPARRPRPAADLQQRRKRAPLPGQLHDGRVAAGLRRRRRRPRPRCACHYRRLDSRLSRREPERHPGRRLLGAGRSQHLRNVSPRQRPHPEAASGQRRRPALAGEARQSLQQAGEDAPRSQVRHDGPHLAHRKNAVGRRQSQGRRLDCGMVRRQRRSRHRRQQVGQAHPHSKRPAHQVLGTPDLSRRRRPSARRMGRASRRALPAHRRAGPLSSRSPRRDRLPHPAARRQPERRRAASGEERLQALSGLDRGPPARASSCSRSSTPRPTSTTPTP